MLPHALFDRKRLVVASLPAVIAVSIFWGLSSHSYVAEATLKPVGARGSMSSLASVASQLGVGLGVSGEEQSLEYYIALLRSRSVLRDVLQLSVDVGVPGSATGLMTVLGAEGEDDRDLLNDAFKRLRERVNAYPDLRAGLIRLSVEMETASSAEVVAQAVLRSADSIAAEVRRAQASDELEFLEERLSDARRSLRSAEDELAAFRASNRITENSPTLAVELERRQRKVDLASQLFGAIEREREAAGAEVARGTSSWVLIEEPSMSARRESRPYLLLLLATFAIAYGALTVAANAKVFAPIAQSRE